jgi:hypothetical protein
MSAHRIDSYSSGEGERIPGAYQFLIATLSSLYAVEKSP